MGTDRCFLDISMQQAIQLRSVKKTNKKNTLCSSVFGLETFKGLCRKEMGGLGVQIYDLAIDEHTII